MSNNRLCTCPVMERPHPCARKFSLSECKAATVLDPIIYRWRHQKDEIWKYGHQPQHLVPPRGKELIGYYIVQPLYSADALAAARRDALEEAAKVCEKQAEDYEPYGGVALELRIAADAIHALIEKAD